VACAAARALDLVGRLAVRALRVVAFLLLVVVALFLPAPILGRPRFEPSRAPEPAGGVGPAPVGLAIPSPPTVTSPSAPSARKGPAFVEFATRILRTDSWGADLPKRVR